MSRTSVRNTTRPGLAATGAPWRNGRGSPTDGVWGAEAETKRPVARASWRRDSPRSGLAPPRIAPLASSGRESGAGTGRFIGSLLGGQSCRARNGRGGIGEVDGNIGLVLRAVGGVQPAVLIPGDLLAGAPPAVGAGGTGDELAEDPCRYRGSVVVDDVHLDEAVAWACAT